MVPYRAVLDWCGSSSVGAVVREMSLSLRRDKLAWTRSILVLNGSTEIFFLFFTRGNVFYPFTSMQHLGNIIVN